MGDAFFSFFSFAPKEKDNTLRALPLSMRSLDCARDDKGGEKNARDAKAWGRAKVVHYHAKTKHLVLSKRTKTHLFANFQAKSLLMLIICSIFATVTKIKKIKLCHNKNLNLIDFRPWRTLQTRCFMLLWSRWPSLPDVLQPSSKLSYIAVSS